MEIKKFMLDGVERHFLFTLAAVDEIQAHYDLPVSSVMSKLADEKENYQTLSYMATVLANDEIRRENAQGAGKEELTEQQVKWLIDVPLSTEVTRAVMKAYGFSLPEPEDDDPNPKRSRSS